MFKRLRIKLTLFNMSIFIGILVIFSLIIFLSGNYKVRDTSLQKMWTIAMRNDLFEVPNKELSNKGNMIYVRLGNENNIEAINSPDNIKDDDIEQLIEQALKNEKYNGQIKYENKNYLFLKIILDNEKGSIVAFKEDKKGLSDDKSFILRTSLYIAIYMVMGFLGSLFVSGKALIPIRDSWQRQIDFTADASHELRTPLAVIQTNIELVMDNGQETVESQKKWLNNILTENKRMSKLVNELLTLSRADSGMQKVEKENLRLDKLLKETEAFFKPAAESNNVIIETSGENNIEFYGDKNSLKQLIIILIDNALKYGGDNGSIYVDLEKCSNEIKIVVSDNGQGIKAEDLDKIFDRFYRGDKSRTRNRGGCGLGLSIAKTIVEQHNGTIMAESVLGEGTRFVITFPYKNK